MANKINCNKNGIGYYRLTRTIGKKQNKAGLWIDEKKEFYGRNKSEAESKFEVYKEQRRRGLSSEKQYFGIMLDYYVYNVFINDGSLAITTKEKYENAYKQHIKNCSIVGYSLQEVKALDLQKVYNSLTCPYSTLKAIHNLIRRFYTYLEKEGYCRDITRSLVLPQKEESREMASKGIKTWSEEDVLKIVAGLGEHRHRLTILLALSTGLRESELLALKYSDIKDGKLSVNKQLIKKATIKEGEKTTHEYIVGATKTKASVRIIPLGEALLKEIERHRTWHNKEMMKNAYRTEYIFTTKSGKFYDKVNLITAFNRYHKRIGVEQKGVHVYRSTFGTTLCKKGIPIQTASKLLGHSSINVTAKYYVNIDDEQKREAVEKMDEIIFSREKVGKNTM